MLSLSYICVHASIPSSLNGVLVALEQNRPPGICGFVCQSTTQGGGGRRHLGLWVMTAWMEQNMAERRRGHVLPTLRALDPFMLRALKVASSRVDSTQPICVMDSEEIALFEHELAECLAEQSHEALPVPTLGAHEQRGSSQRTDMTMDARGATAAAGSLDALAKAANLAADVLAQLEAAFPPISISVPEPGAPQPIEVSPMDVSLAAAVPTQPHACASVSLRTTPWCAPPHPGRVTTTPSPYRAPNRSRVPVRVASLVCVVVAGLSVLWLLP